jgi:CheY-like chemotaxis protein
MHEILIVEDNPDNSELAEKILKFYGFETAVTRHGREALKYCETHEPALILMDLSLPDMDGMEVTRQLRANKNTKTVPIIAVTANAMQGVEEAVLGADMNDLLIKPFFPIDLVTIVRKHLKS